MRVQNRKRIHIEPIKSPSPDVANRNIITDTIAPLEDIKRFNQSKSGSKSPKISRSNNFNSLNSYNPQSDNEKDRQIQSLRQQNNRLYQKLKILQSKISETQSFIVQNSRLNHEISILKQQIQREKTYPLKDLQKRMTEQTALNKSGVKTKQSQPASSQILKQFNDRIQRLAQQNRRLLKFLQEKQSIVGYKNRQIQMLKNQIQFGKKSSINRLLNGQKQKIQYQPKQQRLLTSVLSLSELPSNIKSEIQKLFIEYQAEVDHKYDVSKGLFDRSLKDLDSRISQVKILQAILQQRVNKFVRDSQSGYTPAKKIKNNADNTGTATNWKSQGNGQSSRDREGYTLIDDGQDKMGQQKNTSLSTSPIRLLSHRQDPKSKLNSGQIDRLKRQNVMLAQKVQFYQKELQKVQFRLTQKQKEVYIVKERLNEISQLQSRNNYFEPSDKKMRSIGPSSVRYSNNQQISDDQSTPQFKQSNKSQGLSKSQIAFYRQKAENLQRQLIQKIQEINELHDIIESKDHQNEQMKARVGELDNLFESNILDLKKVIDQQKLKNSNLEQENRRLQDQLQKAVKSAQNFSLQLNATKLQFEKSGKQLSYLNEEMERRNSFVSTTFTDYVKTIRELKQLLSDQNVEQDFRVIQQLQINALNIKEWSRQSEQCIQQLRTRLLTNQKYIIELEQQRNVLTFQLEQSKKKYGKLQKVIQQFSNSKKSLPGDRLTNFKIQQSSRIVVSNMSSISGDQHQKSSASCHLKECLKDTFNGLDDMQNKIKLMLNQ